MNIVQAMTDRTLFARWFQGSSWDAWRVFLRALFCLPMSEAEQEAFRLFAGGRAVPSEPVREAWLVVGRRGGKSLIAALIAVYLAAFRDYAPMLGPGERATIMIIAADRRQARVIMRYLAAFLRGVPMLSGLIENETKEGLELSNRVNIEIHTASFRSTRGYTIAACICDEIAFWRSEDSANPDEEILSAVRPGMASIPGSLLLALSSPYARRGAMWKAYSRHYGKDSAVLVWQAGTQDMNPGIPDEVIEQAMEEDESAARAEYLAEFRRDIESYISKEAVEACIVDGRRELPFCPQFSYVGFTDPSGGSADSFTLAISHRETDGRAVLDAVREERPPFSPEQVVERYAGVLTAYRIPKVYGDRYAGEWPAEQFRKHGITYEPSDKSKSEIYQALLPLLNSRKAELLDISRLTAQLCNLERRTARGGRDSIDHPPNAHDDLVNAAAGALVKVGSGFVRKIDPKTGLKDIGIS